MTDQFLVLDELELLEFFGTTPVVRAPEDGQWCYEASDDRKLTLRFSFDVHERSVQTVVSVGGTRIASVSHEGAERMLIIDGKLRCEFSTPGEKTTLVVHMGPVISLEWSSLRQE